MRVSFLSGIALACAFALVAPRAAQADLMDGLIGYWSFDADASDSSGNAYDGTVQNIGGTSAFGAASLVNGGWDTTSNGAGWPSMVSPYIQLPAGNGNELRLAGTSFTLAGWFKFDSLAASGNAHMFNGNYAGSTGYYVGLQPGNPESGQTPQFGFSTGNASAEITWLPNGGWEQGLWYFFSAFFNTANNEVKVWLINENQPWGNQSGAVTNVNVLPGDPGVDPTIGRTSAPGAFDGVRDEFMMWNRVLTYDELGTVFTTNLAGNSAVPEPSSLVLAGLGLVGLLAYAWRKRKQ